MFFGVPTMYHRLAESGRADELSALRLCVAGSAPLSADLWRRFDGDFGVSVLERYGMSETLLTLSNPLEGGTAAGVGRVSPARRGSGDRRPRRSGNRRAHGARSVPLPGLLATAPTRPRRCGSDGWFATGDLASVEDDGYISIRGRRTELIITGGHNVYPAEVEAVLARHQSVREIAVIGVPSAEWGESVTAFVVGLDGEPGHRGVGAAGGTRVDVLQAAERVPCGGCPAPQRHGQGRPAGSPSTRGRSLGEDASRRNCCDSVKPCRHF